MRNFVWASALVLLLALAHGETVKMVSSFFCAVYLALRSMYVLKKLAHPESFPPLLRTLQEHGLPDADATACGNVRTLPAGKDKCQYVKLNCETGIGDVPHSLWAACSSLSAGSSETEAASRPYSEVGLCFADSLIPYLQLFYCHAQPAGMLAEVACQV